MSIKKFFLRIRNFFVFSLLVFVLALCLIPAKGYGWFHHPTALDLKQNRDLLQVFKDKRTMPNITKTYHFLQNQRKKEKMPMLCSSSAGTGVTAGTVNIDIPFDVLSKTVIFPEASLDRQIAANLRLKHIIDEYLSLKKRNAQVLKGLAIPYLEKNDTSKKNRPDPVPEKIKAEKEARKTMENVIVFSGEAQAEPVNRQTVVSVAEARKKDRQKIIPVGDILKFRSSPGYPGKSVETVGKNSYQTAYGSNTELPWFFAFGLKLIRYAVHNKLDIFLWASVLIMSGLIGILVVKR